MISKYLNSRAEILSGIIKKNKIKYEHNQIVILESNNKIGELENIVDEASEIFSIKAREDTDFKKQEIKDLEIRIAAYVSKNKDLSDKIDVAEKELTIVNQCLKELSNHYVSRETLMEEENKSNFLSDKMIDSSIIEKLEFCKSIAEIDGKRVRIELDNIIQNIDM